MAYESNPQTLTASFSAAGFDDVNVGEVITARKDDGRAWEVMLDRGGQLRVTVTYRGTRPGEDVLPILGRDASIMLEKRTVTTVFFTLQDASELPAALEAIDAAVSAGNRGIRSLSAKRKAAKNQADAKPDESADKEGGKPTASAEADASAETNADANARVGEERP